MIYTKENDKKRVAFYQAGKCVVQTLLLHHPKISILKVKELSNNVVSSSLDLSIIEYLSTLSQKTKLNSNLLTTIDLQTLLIGFYAGKAGEFFNCHTYVLKQSKALLSVPCLQKRSFDVTKQSFVSALVDEKKIIKRKTKFNYKKSRLTKKQCKKVIRLIEKRSCKQKLSKFGLDKLYKTNFYTLRAIVAKAKQCKSEALQKRRNQSFAVQKGSTSFLQVRACKKQIFVFCTRKYSLLASTRNKGEFGFLKQTTSFSDKFLTTVLSAIVRSDVVQCIPKQSFGPLHKYQLPRKQYDNVFRPLNYFRLTNRLNGTKINHLLHQSDTGLLERRKATFLAKYLIINQSIYFSHFVNLQKNSGVGNLNKIEISDSKVFDFFSHFQEQINNIFLKDIIKSSLVLQEKSLSDSSVYSKLFQKKREFVTKKINLLSQKKQISAWCEEKVCKTLKFSNKSYGHWFRIYLPQIETHQRQPVSQDQFFNTRFQLELSVSGLGNISYTQMPALLIRGIQKHSKVNTNKRLYKSVANTPLQLVQNIERGSVAKHSFDKECYLGARFLPQEFDYGMCNNLLVKTLSQALNIIGQNRELLDLVTDHLIRFEKIRVPEILRIYLLYTEDNSFRCFASPFI